MQSSSLLLRLGVIERSALAGLIIAGIWLLTYLVVR
jgi:hypothetical protein